MNEQSAEIAAILETYFNDIVEIFTDDSDEGSKLNLKTVCPDLADYYLAIAPGVIEKVNGESGYKCISVIAPNGDIYVHFRGTGDGYWRYNDAAYGEEASPVQKKSTEYLQSVIEQYKDRDDISGNFYVTGHSQGGNTAQYATLAIDPKYSDYITQTISLDGPGFSEDVLRQLMMNPKYEEQLNKIYAVNGYRDYVSALGQVQVVPKDHVYMIHTYDVGVKTDSTDIANRGHAVNFMIYQDNNGLHLGDLTPYYDDNGEPNTDSGESDFRKLVVAVNDKVKELNKEDQAFAAMVTMMLLEHKLGDGYGNNIQGKNITPEQWERFSELLAEVLSETIENKPELLLAVLQEVGIKSFDSSFVDAETAQYIQKFVKGFNMLPDGVRKTILMKIIGVSLVVADGNMDFPLKRWFERVKAVLNRCNVHSFREFLDFLSSSSAETIFGFVLAVVTDPLETIYSLGKTIVDIILIVVVAAALLEMAKIALKLVMALAAIVAALAALKIVFDFLVEMGQKILGKIKEGIDYMTELAHNIYERIQQTITTVVDAAVDTAIGIYKEMKSGYERFAESVSVFAGYVRGVIAQGQHLFTSIACSISRALTGCPQPVVSINVTLLSDTVDSMQRLANRVQTMDRRLDSLYSWLARDNIEQSEGVWTSLVNLYNLMRADISVDEGGRIRRMANNLSGLFTGYEDAEKWVLQQL